MGWSGRAPALPAADAGLGLHHKDAGCGRLMSVPGIGPIISSAVVAAIGSGDVFSKGRDFAAWLGLVPKQISTGDRTILGKISKRGNRYLRVLFVQAAWVGIHRSLTIPLSHIETFTCNHSHWPFECCLYVQGSAHR